MEWNSPLVLALAGTLAIHTILLTATDAIEHYVTIDPVEERTVIDIEDVPPPPPPPPPLEIKKIEEPKPEPKPEPVAPKVARIEPAVKAPPPPPDEPPPPPATTPGGGDVIRMDNLGLDAKGRVDVMPGKAHDAVGRSPGGHGTGPANAAGSGSGAEVPKPVSIATIKTRAMPKGDYGYFDAGKEYPAEARQLGIEGAIRVRLVVDAGGKVKSAVLLNNLGHGLDELALTRARLIEFDPARDTDDKPVSSVVVWTFNMTLPK